MPRHRRALAALSALALPLLAAPWPSQSAASATLPTSTSASASSSTSASSSASSAAADAPVPVQLLSFTDFHGQLEPGSGTDGTVKDSAGNTITVGGAAYLATHLKQLRQGHENSILFSAGDNFSGWPKSTWSAQDEPTIEVMNQLGVDFSAVGNHELDVSQSFLVDHMMHGKCFGKIGLDSCFTDSTGHRFHGADFPYATGNILDRDGQQILAGTVVERVKVPGTDRTLPVGFVNLTVPAVDDGVNLERSYHPDMDTTPIVETANAEAAQLRRAGVRAIIVNVHQGAGTTGGYDQCKDVSGPMVDADQQLSPDIDAVVTGHWHQAWVCMRSDANGQPRPFVEAGHAGRLINEIDLQLDPTTGEVLRDKTVAVNHPVTRDVTPDPRMQATVDYWVKKNVHTRGIPIARIAKDVTNVRTAAQESQLGNLIADAYQWDANRGPGRSDLALFMTTAGAWYQDDLTVAPGREEGDKPGSIAAGDSWNTDEYASNIDTVTLTGAELVKVLEGQWQKQADGSEQFLPFAVSSGLRYRYDASKPLGSRIVVSSVRIGGRALSLSRAYRVTMPVRMIFGLDQFPGLDKVVEPVRHDRMRDAFRWYLQALGTVRPPATGRVSATGIAPLDVSGTAYLSDLPWVTAFSGWKAVARDQGVGGIPLTLSGVRYAKGLGIGSAGEVNYRPGGRCSRLTATLGIDDYVAKDAATGASSALQVFADGRKVYDSGVMHPGSTKALDIPLTGVQSLMLRVTTGGDGTFADRADFADARITCGG